MDSLRLLNSRRDSTVSAMHAALMGIRSYSLMGDSLRSRLYDELHHAVGRTLELASHDDPFSEDDLEFFRDIGRRRGAERFPISDVRAGFRLSYMAGLRDIFSDAESYDHSDLMHLVAFTSREQPRLLESAEAAYLEVWGRRWDPDLVRGQLVESLLAGQPDHGLASTLGQALPDEFLTLVVRVQMPNEIDPSAPRTPLDTVLSDEPNALWRGDPRQGEFVVLLPIDARSTTSSVRLRASHITETLSKLLGRRVIAATAWAAPLSSVPQAYSEARQAIPLIAALPEIHSRPYSTDELLVELAIVRQPDLQERLEQLLGPLRVGTELVATLDALFANNLSREQTARALYIHRRTLGYRINRIRRLTGIDPDTAHGVQLLRVALTASRLATPTYGPKAQA